MKRRRTSSRGRTTTALFIAMIVLVVGSLVFLARQGQGDETQARDAPLAASGRERTREPSQHVQLDDLPMNGAPSSAPSRAKGRAKPGARVTASRSDIGEGAAYRLELRMIDRLGRLVQGASAQVIEPDEALDPILTTPGVVMLRTSRLVPHILEVTGPESDDLAFVGATVAWVPDPTVPVSEMEVVLHLAGRLQGSLQCSDGSSPRSASIDIFHIESKEWSNAAAIENGTFMSDWLPAGELIVYSRNGSWAGDDLRERDIITLVEGQTYAYSGTLAPAIELVGTVVDAAGRPRPNTSVDIYDARNPQYSESVLSGEDGRFVCDALYPGTYHLDLPESAGTRRTSFTVQRGWRTRDMGHLVHRSKKQKKSSPR